MSIWAVAKNDVNHTFAFVESIHSYLLLHVQNVDLRVFFPTLIFMLVNSGCFGALPFLPLPRLQGSPLVCSCSLFLLLIFPLVHPLSVLTRTFRAVQLPSFFNTVPGGGVSPSPSVTKLFVKVFQPPQYDYRCLCTLSMHHPHFGGHCLELQNGS